MLDAIEQIEIRRWIYLKDTRSYSVFLRDDCTAAYAVQGLTDRLRAISGHSGIVLLAGVFPLAGQFVCDGLFANVMTLGPNYMEDFRLRYQALRESGDFYTVPDVGAASAANGGGGFAAEAAPTAAARKKRRK
ncbi:MAG: hypothetical protein IPN40_04545 [Uliginosibacterium sp.]|nr:hypothetical protein [Uliginosibacterium sp.]